jgi:hypothetical protein
VAHGGASSLQVAAHRKPVLTLLRMRDILARMMRRRPTLMLTSLQCGTGSRRRYVGSGGMRGSILATGFRSADTSPLFLESSMNIPTKIIRFVEVERQTLILSLLPVASGLHHVISIAEPAGMTWSQCTTWSHLYVTMTPDTLTTMLTLRHDDLGPQLLRHNTERCAKINIKMMYCTCTP